MTVLKRRDFLAANRARKTAMPGFVLQARARPADDRPNAIRVGFTCSKKVGNAVARNHAKRRLRAAVHKILHTDARKGWDYILIGRKEATSTLPFEVLCRDLKQALQKIHS